MKKFALLAALTAFVALPVAAEPLTKDMVKDHLEQENKLLKSNAGKFAPAEVQDFLQKHLSDTYVYSDIVTLNIGQFGTTKESLNYNKMDYIDTALGNIHNVKSADADISIKDVQISGDGTQARVQYVVKAKLKAMDDQLSAMTSGRPIEFQTTATSNCASQMRWDDFVDTIQTEKTTCTTNAQMNIPDNFTGGM